MMHRSIFIRPWQAPEYPVVFEALSVSILIAMGYQGPPAGDSLTGSTGPTMLPAFLCNYRWPPALPRSMPRDRVAAHLLSVVGGEGPLVEALIEGSTVEDPEPIIAAGIEQMQGVPLVSVGGCLAPAFVDGDEAVAEDGPIAPGDFVAIVLRGSITPLIKVFVSMATVKGERRALFYLAQPSQLIAVRPADVLYATKVRQPRDISGGDLIGRAGNSLRQYCHDHHAPGCLPEGQFKDRWSAWGETMREIYTLLRQHPDGRPA